VHVGERERAKENENEEERRRDGEREREREREREMLERKVRALTTNIVKMRLFLERSSMVD